MKNELRIKQEQFKVWFNKVIEQYKIMFNYFIICLAKLLIIFEFIHSIKWFEFVYSSKYIPR